MPSKIWRHVTSLKETTRGMIQLCFYAKYVFTPIKRNTKIEVKRVITEYLKIFINAAVEAERARQETASASCGCVTLVFNQKKEVGHLPEQDF